MKNSVKVTANPNTGLVFTPGSIGKDGKQYGFYRVESTTVDRSSAIDRVVVLSALRPTTQEAFDKAPLMNGEEISGKILIKESNIKNPFRANQEAKRAGKDGGVLLFNGLPIYRETEFTSDMSAQDVLIAHTSVAPVAAQVSAKLNS